MDKWTNGWIKGRIEKTSFRIACPQKNIKHEIENALKREISVSYQIPKSTIIVVGLAMGVFLVTKIISIVPVKYDNSVNTYSRISTVPRGSEQSDKSKPVNGASEESEWSNAERCGVRERSELCERMNVASDRVAR